MSRQHTALLLKGESKRGRKQRDFAPKNAIHFVLNFIIFQKVESRTSKLSFYYAVLSSFYRLLRIRFVHRLPREFVTRYTCLKFRPLFVCVCI